MSRINLFLVSLAMMTLVSGVVCAQTCSPPPTCGANQVSKWNGSGWTCATFSCRQVTGADSSFSQAFCNSDEILVGGGGVAEVPGEPVCGGGTKKGFLHDSHPHGNSWVANAFGDNWTSDVCVRSYAICCKIQ